LCDYDGLTAYKEFGDTPENHHFAVFVVIEHDVTLSPTSSLPLLTQRFCSFAITADAILDTLFSFCAWAGWSHTRTSAASAYRDGQLRCI